MRSAGGGHRDQRPGAATARAALARDGLLELGYAPGEAEELLRDADRTTSAEELIAHALRAARAG